MTDDTQATAHPPHILVVDDDPALRELLQGYLGEADMRVTAVDSGRRLFEVFDEEAIDLVVLDLRLPGEDGLALARQLRERAPVPVIPLTLSSGTQPPAGTTIRYETRLRLRRLPHDVTLAVFDPLSGRVLIGKVDIVPPK